MPYIIFYINDYVNLKNDNIGYITAFRVNEETNLSNYKQDETLQKFMKSINYQLDKKKYSCNPLEVECVPNKEIVIEKINECKDKRCVIHS